ncbi:MULTISPECIES: type I restriction-modification system subunit M [Klebsiella]|uniref:type I restriction-modification system subunit M n=1 Tax=Klebsiella TaxID=570 RepID=UPI001330FF9B|nr:type I restriction-modification system subunit M [Klebsiella pneumoniae]MBK2440599.1 N-6 DNA methylase [Klebsiella pneumoniae]MCE0254306.1 type I restriction-modification system subunit M [Klebsiella pneumoniae]MCP5819320.1 type I restriction-modification system subunit M [Klebsiella pneumoniae]MCP6622919.1 type I restriction-modification system subunit M [Klebsiella pneumoniae]MCP6710423.1 type I restriction-modification system subunit M [Klebsiella pneumoniae]
MSEMKVLHKSLLLACDLFRGKVDPSSYKDYIFSMLLLKYISDVKADYEYDLINKEYSELLEIVSRVPEDASFYKIYHDAKNHGDYIGERIDDSLRLIDQAIDSVCQSRGGYLFESIKFATVNFGAKSERDRMLNELLDIFASPEMKFDYTQDGNKKIEVACRYLFEKIASDSAMRGAEFYTPEGISLLFAELLQPRDGDSICDPTCGSGSLLITLGEKIKKSFRSNNYTLFGQEVNRSIWALAKMNMIMHNEINSRIEWGDVISNPQLLDTDNRLMQFDVVASNPPLNIIGWNHDDLVRNDYGRFNLGFPPHSKGDYAFILHMVSTLKSATGRMAILVSHGVLFRGGQEESIRKNLISEGLLDAVIGLPDRLLPGTAIPTAILIFRRDRNNSDVVFIDASDLAKPIKGRNLITNEIIEKVSKCYFERSSVDDFSHVASYDEIQLNDFNLNISRYVKKHEEQVFVDLEILRKQREELLSTLHELEREMKGFIDN